MTNPSPTNENAMTLEQAFEHGISLYQHQKKKEAREVFEQILSHAPEAVPVLQVLAVMDTEDGAWQVAIAKLDKALTIEPGNASLLFDKASVLTQYGVNKEALDIIDSLLAVAPDHQELLTMRQQVTAASGKLGESRRTAKYKAASQEQKNSALGSEVTETLNLAKQMLTSNNIDQAKQLYQAVISVAGDVPEALLGLARVHIQEDKQALAYQTLSRAADQTEPNKDIWVLLCHTAIKIEDYRAARAHCQFSLKQWPEDPILCRLMLLSYLKEEKWLEAYRRSKEYVRLFPNDADIRYRLANASFNLLKSRHNFTPEAIKECQGLIESASEIAKDKSKLDLSRYLAEVLWYKGEAREAKALLEAYMAQYPDDVDSGFNSSFVYRSLEEWDEYYRTNELGIESGKRLKYRGDIPQWDLTRPKEDVVLVMPEQGVGDELLYLHNLDIVLNNCQKAYVACDPRLVTLVQASFPDVHTIPITRSDNQDIQIPESVLNEANSWIAGGSLAALCYREYGRHVFRPGYIQLPAPITAKWKVALDKVRQANPGKPLIGICWRSGLAAASRNMHYLIAEETAHLLKQLPDAVFINLQYGECKKELEKMAKLTGTRVLQLDGLDLRGDFCGTAAVIGELDTVITAGTAVHRLTTAVGTPCHVYFAGTNESDFSCPRELSNEKEIGYFYPPMMENKYPLLESMATNIKRML
ncbi:hypothetical protein LRP49_19100 [Enterovibrio sp. ZSDZ35]|uniref:Tetratricopeptide repeat-containing protein n=1 Tax=Enterovibrio qingdaonensis TaxID=2899818 RepID=A0ABT5QQM1_9GAMM|nr:tetratricopeptide repeat protein [Enterovibrio sp. ZSDZ35]MDD1783281.1 hypothetical protein [Enterovibrio sp. ZSDZ35]